MRMRIRGSSRFLYSVNLALAFPLSNITTGQNKLEREGSGGYGMIGLARLIAPNKISGSSRIGS